MGKWLGLVVLGVKGVGGLTGNCPRLLEGFPIISVSCRTDTLFILLVIP